MEDKRVIGFVILVIISIIVSFVMVYYLNRDYKLNRGKRAISSRYRKIANGASIVLIALLVNTMRILLEFYVNKYSVSDGIFRLLFIIAVLLFPAVFVASLRGIAFSNYNRKIRKNVKDTKNEKSI
ncbi:MAG: hypothetical protein LBH32_02420 [Dysgonamonadaceae bacterium]|jgi:hypothetical protein|nr:hypothetical protein [Dysgonamonadaceae bacterium]